LKNQAIKISISYFEKSSFARLKWNWQWKQPKRNICTYNFEKFCFHYFSCSGLKRFQDIYSTILGIDWDKNIKGKEIEIIWLLKWRKPFLIQCMTKNKNSCSDSIHLNSTFGLWREKNLKKVNEFFQKNEKSLFFWKMIWLHSRYSHDTVLV
jgi:hypothetical protein